jgi:thiamine-phosphate pyrophosphorylase
VTPRLQFLTLDASPLSHPEQARAALRGGVRWIQIRAKGRDEDEWVALARAVVALCREHGATCVVNDSPRVARLAGADGVHLGPEDATPAEARRELGEAAIVGATLNFPAHLDRLGATRIDYVGVGPFRPTTSKAKLAPVHSADSLAALIAAAAPRPAFAIGGVAAADFPALRALGAYGIAVSGAIALAADPEAAARALVAAVGD